jgi:hypothetical protein
MTVKRRNTIIFVAVASVFNLILTLALLLGGYLLIVLIFKSRMAGGAESIDVNLFNALLVCDLVGSLVLSNVIYRLILRLINKKVDFEAHFDPIFKARNRRD